MKKWLCLALAIVLIPLSVMASADDYQSGLLPFEQAIASKEPYLWYTDPEDALSVNRSGGYYGSSYLELDTAKTRTVMIDLSEYVFADGVYNFGFTFRLSGIEEGDHTFTVGINGREQSAKYHVKKNKWFTVTFRCDFVKDKECLFSITFPEECTKACLDAATMKKASSSEPTPVPPEEPETTEEPDQVIREITFSEARYANTASIDAYNKKAVRLGLSIIGGAIVLCVLTVLLRFFIKKKR